MPPRTSSGTWPSTSGPVGVGVQPENPTVGNTVGAWAGLEQILTDVLADSEDWYPNLLPNLPEIHQVLGRLRGALSIGCGYPKLSRVRSVVFVALSGFCFEARLGSVRCDVWQPHPVSQACTSVLAGKHSQRALELWSLCRLSRQDSCLREVMNLITTPHTPSTAASPNFIRCSPIFVGPCRVKKARLPNSSWRAVYQMIFCQINFCYRRR